MKHHYYCSYLLLWATLMPCSVVSQLGCFSTFALAGVDIVNYDNYVNFFNDESVMELAQAGQYIGLENIEEYARFSGVDSPFLEREISYTSTTVKNNDEYAEPGGCVLLTYSFKTYRTNPNAAKERVFSRGGLAKIYYTPVSYNRVMVQRANIYFSEPYLNYYFGDVLAGNATLAYNCNVMQNNCPETWALNGFSDNDDCVRQLSSLPMTDAGADATGNTTACKTLHSSFAAMNSDHCPHISLTPQEDVNGLEKCQHSSMADVATLFDEKDMAFLDENNRNHGLPESSYYECNCAEETRQNTGGIRASAVNRFNRVSPLPEIWPSRVAGSVPLCQLC